MQAVIIAGGLGTRLRPLTLNRPKALVPLLNRPQILHILDRVPTSVDEVFVAVNYMFERVREFFEVTDVDRTVEVIEEPTPLGTGGAVRNVADRIEGTFAVFNGDVVDDLDFREFLAFHRRHKAVATIALHEVDDPGAFGVVALEGDRITRFVEKPAAGEAPSRLINAGRYLFEPEVLDAIDAGKPVSMETDVFPKLSGSGLYGFPFDGYWSDAGTREGYRAATAILLANGGAAVDPTARVSRARLDGAVLVPAGCEVSGRLGPNVVLGPRCRVDGATVSDSTLLDGAIVDAGATVLRSIVGEDATVGPGATVEDSIVGDDVRVRKGRRVIRERMA